jgi:hypothetical protein
MFDSIKSEFLIHAPVQGLQQSVDRPCPALELLHASFRSVNLSAVDE